MYMCIYIYIYIYICIQASGASAVLRKPRRRRSPIRLVRLYYMLYYIISYYT